MPGAKKPLVLWKEYQESPPDRALVEEWWTRWPDAGICLVLGPVSGVVAVDVDSSDAERVLFDLLGGEPRTLKSLSGSRKPSKAHYLLQCPDFPTAAKYTPLHPQLELRGHGGYIVLPPSVHHSGNCYEWDEPHQPIAILPEALASVWQGNPRFAAKPLRPSRHQTALGHSADASSALIVATDLGASLLTILRLPGLAVSTQRWLTGCCAHQAGWNENLFCAACDLAGLNVPLDVAAPLLLMGAQPDTPADEDQACRTIRSAYAEPRVPLREYLAALGANNGPRRPPRILSDRDGVRLLARVHLRRSTKVEE